VVAAVLLVIAVPQSRPDSLDHGVAWDLVQPEGFHQMMVVGPEYLNPETLKKLYQERAKPSDRFFRIDAVETRVDADHMSGPGASDQEFQDWERRLREVRNRDSFRMMRLVAMGKDVVIETVNGSKASSEVISGHDPMRFGLGGRVCRLLEVYWSRPLSPPGQGRPSPLDVKVDLMTDVLPEVSVAEKITAELQRRLNYSQVMTFMRGDTWFIDDEQFPLWFPFAPGAKPPSLQEYIAKGVMVCVGGAEVRCHRSVR
jgi:hypothetical protein